MEQHWELPDCSLTKVSEVMSRDVPKVNLDDSVLDACETILGKHSTGAVVFQGNRAVGMITERTLLRRFAPLDRKPSAVKVSEVMAPILRIDKSASTVEAAKKLLTVAFTRLCVFEGDKFVGWVTLTDLARNTTKRGLLRALATHYKPEEVMCPKCKVGVLEMRIDSSGIVQRWDCNNCSYSE